MENTLIIIKPDAVSRGLIGNICNRIEQKGLQISSLSMTIIPSTIIEEHYAHHSDKSFFPDLVSFMTSGPSVLLRVKGISAVDVMRNMCGATNGREALPGTIRGDYSQSNQLNLVHSSDSPENALIEIERFKSVLGPANENGQDISFVYAEDEL